jgi:rare lipoprotein A
MEFVSELGTSYSQGFREKLEMTMTEVESRKNIFGGMSRRKFFGAGSSKTAMLAYLLLAIATASCGHKRRSVARVPSASQPRPRSQPAVPPRAGSPPAGSLPIGSLPIGYTEVGVASWYGIPYHGRRAADGEIYNMETLVAAHRLMPFNTWLCVTNLSNGKTVNVRIIDRGPFIDGRLIDLSKAAARQIDLIGPGTGRVRLQVISEPRDIPSNDFYAVQVGSFTVLANAEQARTQYAQRYGLAQLATKSAPITRWRVLVGKFATVESARELANVLSGENPDIFIVRLDETVVPPSTAVPPPAIQTVPLGNSSTSQLR